MFIHSYKNNKLKTNKLLSFVALLSDMLYVVF